MQRVAGDTVTVLFEQAGYKTLGLEVHEPYRETMHWIEGAGLPAADVAHILDQSGPALLGPPAGSGRTGTGP